MITSVSSLLFFVKDKEKTFDFYSKLGFDTKYDEGMVQVKVNWFFLNFIDKEKALFKEVFDVEPKGAGVFTYTKVDDVDEYYKLAIEKGIEPSSEPTDRDWGNREFVIKDPDGYKLVFFNKSKK